MSIFLSIFLASEAGGPPETHSWIWPERAEIVYGCTASIIIFAALIKFGGPLIKKSLSARTEKIQKDLDAGRSDKSSAQTEATAIRAALGDIDAERTRILAEADVQAASLLAEGRTRITQEMAALETKAEADIAAAAARSGDELRAEIARLAGLAAERVVSSSLDDNTKQTLIENFISNVGATR